MQVQFPDGTILHGKFGGTTSISFSALFNTPNEVWEAWDDYPTHECTCGRMEVVRLATSYGGGFSWTGEACRHCMALKNDHFTRYPFEGRYSRADMCGFGWSRDDTDENNKTNQFDDGLPDWWVRRTE